jgi:hypothetical protein
VKDNSARIRRVKFGTTTLAILMSLAASLALADDFRTSNGKEYKNATVIRVEGDGIVLKSKTGISKVYFIELPKDVQEKFHYGPAKPIPAQREREPITAGTTQDGPRQANGGSKVVVVGQTSGRRQADGGGKLVVVGQTVGSLKVIGAGIVVLLVVVLAVLRNRSRISKSSKWSIGKSSLTTSAKPVGVTAMCRRWIAKGAQSGLLTRNWWCEPTQLQRPRAHGIRLKSHRHPTADATKLRLLKLVRWATTNRD